VEGEVTVPITPYAKRAGALAPVIGRNVGPSDLNNYHRPHDSEETLIADALLDLEKVGMGQIWREGIDSWQVMDNPMRDDLGSFERARSVLGERRISVSEKMLEAIKNNPQVTRSQGMLRQTLAHEMSHGIDMPVTGEIYSVSSPRFATDIRYISMTEDGQVRIPANAFQGDVILEMVIAYAENSGGMREYLSYPFQKIDLIAPTNERHLGDNYFIQYEAFAQLSSLYFTKPEAVRKYLPAGWEFMRRVHGAVNSANTVDDRNERVREVFQSPVSDGIAQGELFRKITGAYQSVPGAGGPGAAAGAQQQVGRASNAGSVAAAIVPPEHVPLKSGPRKGQLALPPGMTEADLPRLRLELAQLALEGEPSKLWYKKSADRILQVTEGNLVEAEKLAQVIAVTSPEARVSLNTDWAIRAYEQVKKGQPIQSAKYGHQRQKLNDILINNKPWTGKKTSSFYINLMMEIDPSIIDKIYVVTEGGVAAPRIIEPGERIPKNAVKNSEPVTVDRWIARIFGYGDRVSAAEYELAQREVVALAHALGWPAHEVQAAMWVAFKARWETVAAGGRTRSSALALRAIPPERMEDAAGDYSTFLDRATSSVTWEVEPGSSTGISLFLPTPQARREFLDRAVSIIDENGRDGVADRIGVPFYHGIKSTGAYEKRANPNVVTGITSAKQRVDAEKIARDVLKVAQSDARDPSGKRLKRDAYTFSAQDATIYALALQIIYKQNAVPWFRADPTLDGENVVTGVRMKLPMDITEGMAQELAESLAKIHPGYGFTKVSSDEIAVLNFKDPDSHQPFGLNDTIFLEAMDSLSDEIGAIEYVDFKAETYYRDHDWGQDPKGAALEKTISDAGRSDLLPWIRDRAAAYERLLAEEQQREAIKSNEGLLEDALYTFTDQDVEQEENTTDPSDLVSPVSGTPHQMALGLRQLGKENNAIVQPILEQLDKERGTKSRTNFKKIATIKSKAVRPEVLQKKPWFTVAHIRDGFRFMTEINDVSDATRAMELLRSAGVTVVKADTEKLVHPKGWGWHIVVFDLRFPNGQIVEYYLPFKEMEAQKQTNHLLFEKWRDEDTNTLPPKKRLEFLHDYDESERTYEAAFASALERLGQDESALRASRNRLLASLSGTGENSSMISVAEGKPVSAQAPSGERTAQNASSMRNTRESSETSTFNIDTTSTGILPQTASVNTASLGPTRPSATARPIIFTPPGTPVQQLPQYAGDTGSINLDKLSSPEEIRATIDKIARDYRDIQDTARRGVRDWGTTERAAEALGMTVKQLAKRKLGSTFNAEQIEAARTLMEASAADLHAKAVKAQQTGSNADKLLVQEAFLRHVLIQSQYSGIATEAGRALNILRKRSAGAARIAEVVEEIETFQDMPGLINQLAALDTAGQLTQASRDLYLATKGDMLLELWINSLLSGPQTHATNMLSNALVGEITSIEHMIAAGIGKLHGGEKVSLREAMAYAVGGIQGAREGIKLGAKAFWTEEPQSSPQGKVEARRYQAIPGVAGKTVRIPGRLLMAEDEFFKSMGYRRMLNALAMRQALSEGLGGNALYTRYHELVANPTPEIERQARKHADYVTFTNKLGPFGSGLQGLAAKNPWLRIIIPFIRTPTNIVKFAAARSPAALAMRDTRAQLLGQRGKAARDLAWARVIFGSGIGALVVSLAAKGLISGGGPDDPDRRRVMRQEGWAPYSLYLDGIWHAYSRLEPLGMLLGIAADMVEIQGYMSEDEDANLASMIVGSISKNLTSKTWLRGLSEVIQAIEDPDRYAGGYLRNLAGTVIPTGVAQYARTEDPILRDARTVIDKIKTRIPGKSHEVAAQLDLWGNEIYLEGGAGPDLLSPIYTSRAKADPAARALLDAQYYPSKPSRKVGGVELTPAQYYDYQQIAGQLAHASITRMAQNPGFQSAPRYLREDMLRDAFSLSRRMARQQLMGRYPTLRRAISQSLLTSRLQ